MCRNLIARSALVLLTGLGCGAGLMGCQSPEPEQIYVPEDWQGNVNENLSPQIQAKQQAVIDLFTSIQQNGIDKYAWDCPHIKFDESFKDFFGDAIDLYRWEWAAPPKDPLYSVRIILRKDEPGLPKSSISEPIQSNGAVEAFKSNARPSKLPLNARLRPLLQIRWPTATAIRHGIQVTHRPQRCRLRDCRRPT